MGELAECSIAPRAWAGQVVQKRFHAYRPDIDASKKLLLTLQALHVEEKPNRGQFAETNIPGVHCRTQLLNPLGNAPPVGRGSAIPHPLFGFCSRAW